MSYLQSKMMSTVPSEVPRGMAVAVLNANGVVVHQQGADILATKARPIATADLSPDLPHWQVKVYAVGSVAAATRKGYQILSMLLIAAFAAAIISSGALLLSHARRHSLDASRKTSFVANVSHELKTPLTSIRMYAELLGSDRVRDTAKQKQYLGIIAAESQRLTRLVNNVLDFSRLEQGRRKFHLSALDLNAAITEAVDAMRGRLDAADIAVQMPEPPANGILVAADRDALSQVLLNLIDNAIKYAASGKELAFDIRPLNDTCEVRVMDKGPGIPEPHRQRVFEKFYRIDTSLTATQPGSGLGLSIAVRLMNGMDGSLHFEPRDGGGSAFVLTLKTEKK
jgi:signal transduction histidine kinase